MSDNFPTFPPTDFPDTTPQIPDVPKSNINYWMISTVVLLLILTAGGVYIFTLLNKLSNTTQNATQLALSSPLPSAPVANTNQPPMTLEESFAQFCINNRIARDKLPGVISQELLDLYQPDGSIYCGPFSTNYATLPKVIHTPEFDGYERVLYEFSSASLFEGQGDDLAPLTNYAPITINDKTYYLAFGETDGGTGVDTTRIVLALIAQKEDKAGTLVRVRINSIITNQVALNIVNQYGTSGGSDGPPGTKSISHRSAQRPIFIKKFIELVPQMPEVLEMADNAQADIDEVSFK